MIAVLIIHFSEVTSLMQALWAPRRQNLDNCDHQLTVQAETKPGLTCAFGYTYLSIGIHINTIPTSTFSICLSLSSTVVLLCEPCALYIFCTFDSYTSSLFCFPSMCLLPFNQFRRYFVAYDSNLIEIPPLNCTYEFFTLLAHLQVQCQAQPRRWQRNMPLSYLIRHWIHRDCGCEPNETAACIFLVNLILSTASFDVHQWMSVAHTGYVTQMGEEVME